MQEIIGVAKFVSDFGNKMKMDFILTADDIINRKVLEEKWYNDYYTDVFKLNLDAKYHFKNYGYAMNRAPCFKLKGTRRWKEVLSHPAPSRSNALSRAQEIAHTGDDEIAIEYAKYYLPDHLQYTVNILKANSALKSGLEQEWLKYVNLYLEELNCSPIYLSDGVTLLDRLSGVATNFIDGGPLVSVIMPAWNCEHTIQSAARSILSQSWKNLELIIVDDASTDGTWQQIMAISSCDSRVTALRNTVNVGPYVSKNIGLGVARGLWITGHDSDDWAHPERIEDQVNFSQDGNHLASLSGMARISPQGDFVKTGKLTPIFHDGVCRTSFISLMIRRDYLKTTLGGWDNVRTSGDSEMIRRIESLTGKLIPRINKISMLCLDSPTGLTNHSSLGVSVENGTSPLRSTYKENFLKWHKGLKKSSPRLGLNPPARPFPVPEQLMVPQASVQKLLTDYQRCGNIFERTVEADVVIITNTGFPGGNASSTIDEAEYFRKRGLKCAVVHCPIDRDINRIVSSRYRDNLDIWLNWDEVSKVEANVVICRHPAVIESQSFGMIADRISANRAYFVINNSRFRTDGKYVYDISKLLRNVENVKASVKELCPISDAMRNELKFYSESAGEAFSLSSSDWNPTFNLDLYASAPKKSMIAPYVIGRHGRDGAEKWLEDPAQLLMAYPSGGKYKVSILGGANSARMILGELPENWEVNEFESIPVHRYLSNLDVFIYFPNTALVEGFGRTIVEAMLAGIPVILPYSFQGIFGDLPIYSSPIDVCSIIDRLSTDDTARIDYLNDVQSVAESKFSSVTLERRISSLFATPLQEAAPNILELSLASKSYRLKIMKPSAQGFAQ